MTIALIAHDSKKELMVQFCTAYCRILSQHKLVATGTTGKLIAEATGLQVQRFLAGALQAVDQYLGSGNVGGHGDVVHIAQAQQRHFVGFAGLCVDGVAEEQQQIHLIAGDAGCDLLVAALHTGQKALHL